MVSIYHVKPEPSDLIILLVYIIKTKPKVAILYHSDLGTPPVFFCLSEFNPGEDAATLRANLRDESLAILELNLNIRIKRF